MSAWGLGFVVTLGHTRLATEITIALPNAAKINCNADIYTYYNTWLLEKRIVIVLNFVHMIRILGIDPGTARVGWGLIEENFGRLTTLKYGCITTEKDELAEKRLSVIFHSMTKLLKALKPDCVSVEDLFFATNAKTAIAVGQARGVILLSAAEQDIPVASYSPVAVKKAICGTGTAPKEQVGRMITKLLHLKEIPKPDDTADALAIAATHAYSYKMRRHMQKSR